MKIRAPIIGRRLVAEKTLEVSFGLRGSAFGFVAGQYLNISLDLIYEDEKGNYRDFSIASSPQEETVSIAFRLSGSGFKKTLSDAPLGTMVEIKGPFGNFILPEDVSKEIVFIAGGIGITPFRSMVKYLVDLGLRRKITLLFFNKSRETSPYLDELAALNFEGFVFESIYGPITKDRIKDFVRSAGRGIYIAGPPGFTYESRKIIMELGVDEENIATEEFSGY